MDGGARSLMVWWSLCSSALGAAEDTSGGPARRWQGCISRFPTAWDSP